MNGIPERRFGIRGKHRWRTVPSGGLQIAKRKRTYYGYILIYMSDVKFFQPTFENSPILMAVLI